MHWLDVLVGGGSATGALAVVGAFLSRRAKGILADIVRDVTAVFIKELQTDIVAIKVQLAKETGGNSNGLRQKLNSVAEDVAHLKGVLAPVLVVQGGGGGPALQVPGSLTPVTTETVSTTTATTTTQPPEVAA